MFDLDALQAAAEAATPGEWTHYETLQADNYVTAGGGWLTGAHVCGPTYEKANAIFIAAWNPAVALEFVAAHRAALSRTARVEALHQPTPRLDIWRRREIGGDYCAVCEDEYPCATVRALTEGEADAG